MSKEGSVHTPSENAWHGAIAVLFVALNALAWLPTDFGPAYADLMFYERGFTLVADIFLVAFLVDPPTQS